jgi:hypothetical protein
VKIPLVDRAARNVLIISLASNAIMAGSYILLLNKKAFAFNGK